MKPMKPRITDNLSNWFRRSRQELPWRGSSDPYAIWLSEVMLQQTRIATVIPYWTRFMKCYPDPASLAAAPIEEVLEMWAGLGYYSRGRNLHDAAKMIVEEYGGLFPEDPEQVRRLPGVGEYTTAAICSIAFQQPLAVIDGNVERVLCRVHRIDGDPKSGAARIAIAEAARDALDRHAPGDHNQAMMDLGRRVCTPRNPSCSDCPLAGECGALESGDVSRWPQPRKRRATEEQWWAAAVVVAADEVLLWPSDGELLKGQAGTPLVRLTGPEQDADPILELKFEEMGIPVPQVHGHGDLYQHAITYRKLQVRPLVYRWKGPVPPGVKRIPLHRADRVPALHRKAIAAAQQLLVGEPS